jgi:hypothetical protein
MLFGFVALPTLLRLLLGMLCWLLLLLLLLLLSAS